jgi:hypothetical protein
MYRLGTKSASTTFSNHLKGEDQAPKILYYLPLKTYLCGMPKTLYNAIAASLSELAVLLEHLEHESYTKPIKHLANSTIGQHTRHIIEFFQCLAAGYDAGEFSYDRRQRDLTIEQDQQFAVYCIQLIIKSLDRPDKNLVGQYDLADQTINIQSTYTRELMYNLEHVIHHQALIRVAMIEMEKHEISEHFGVAASTLAFRSQG